jgi:TRAP-type C4-dicarboxylate transport system substrate-binding protein
MTSWSAKAAARMSRRLALAGLGTLGAAPVLAQGLTMSGPQSLTLRAVGSDPAEHLTSQAMQRFVDAVATTTRGRLTIELEPGAGDPDSVVAQVQSGEAAMGWAGLPAFARAAPQLEALTLPFLFPDQDYAFAVADGPVVDLIEVWVRGSGFRILTYLTAGEDVLYVKDGPIRTAEDLQGLRLLVTSPSELAVFEALGAEPTLVDRAAAAGMIAGGEVEAVEAPYSVLAEALGPDATGSLLPIDSVTDLVVVAANEQRFATLPIEYREIVTIGLASATLWQRGASAVAEERARQDLAARGITLQEVSPELLGQLREATQGLVDQARERAGSEFVEAILAAR